PTGGGPTGNAIFPASNSALTPIYPISLLQSPFRPANRIPARPWCFQGCGKRFPAVRAWRKETESGRRLGRYRLPARGRFAISTSGNEQPLSPLLRRVLPESV